MVSKKTKSAARTSLDVEWERLASLVPNVVNDPGMVEDLERDIFSLIDGQSTCEEIVKDQETYSRDGAMLILLKLERDGIIACIEPVERLRDVKFDRCEAEKELEFTSMEKIKLVGKISRIKDEIARILREKKKVKEEVESFQGHVVTLDEKKEALSCQYDKATRSVDELVSKKVDILKRKGLIDKSIVLLREEALFLKDEKSSAMRSIRELESKIDEVLYHRESVIPKMSIYRGVVREAYKTLRDAQARAEQALKGLE